MVLHETSVAPVFAAGSCHGYFANRSKPMIFYGRTRFGRLKQKLVFVCVLFFDQRPLRSDLLGVHLAPLDPHDVLVFHVNALGGGFSSNQGAPSEAKVLARSGA